MAQLASLTLNASSSLNLSSMSSGSDGNLWYNPIAKTMQYSWYGLTWSTQSPLNNTQMLGAGFGSGNAALSIGNQNSATPASPVGFQGLTEEFNGAAWSAGGNLNLNKACLAAAGTLTAGLAFAGTPPGVFPTQYPTATEEYNGTSWSAGGAMNTGRITLTGFGTQNSAVAAGGSPLYPNQSLQDCTENYNGSTWSTGGALITGRRHLGSSGISTEGVIFGGQISNTATNATEEYDGSSWASGGNMITVNFYHTGVGSSQSTALKAGGCNPALSSCTEVYDGSSWSSFSPIITPRRWLSGAGDRDSVEGALIFGGQATGVLYNTEAYSADTNIVNI